MCCILFYLSLFQGICFWVCRCAVANFLFEFFFLENFWGCILVILLDFTDYLCLSTYFCSFFWLIQITCLGFKKLGRL